MQDCAQNCTKSEVDCVLCNKLSVFRTCTTARIGAFEECLSGILSQTFQARHPVPGFFLARHNSWEMAGPGFLLARRLRDPSRRSTIAFDCRAS
jgi:hypothetical protein